MTGASIDGPFSSQGTLWDIASSRGVTQFHNTSAYLAFCWKFSYALLRATVDWDTA